MRRRLCYGLLMAAILMLAACAPELPQGEQGAIPLMPFFSEEMGMQGVQPVGCGQSPPGTFECTNLYPGNEVALLVHQAAPVSLEELAAEVLTQVALEQLPESTGGYKGSAFDWKLYAFETQLHDVGTEITFRIDAAMAEDDSTAYLVALVTLPEEYESHTKLFDTLFTHAVYAFRPWEPDR